MENCLYGPLLEEWKEVLNTNGLYKISNYGVLVSFVKNKNGRISKIAPDNHGYISFKIKIKGTSINAKVHIEQAKAFLTKEANEEIDVNHKNRIRSDNFILNIE